MGTSTFLLYDHNFSSTLLHDVGDQRTIFVTSVREHAQGVAPELRLLLHHGSRF